MWEFRKPVFRINFKFHIQIKMTKVSKFFRSILILSVLVLPVLCSSQLDLCEDFQKFEEMITKGQNEMEIRIMGDFKMQYENECSDNVIVKNFLIFKGKWMNSMVDFVIKKMNID